MAKKKGEKELLLPDPPQIEHLHIDALRLYGNNPKHHTKEQIKKIVESILEYGWTYPVLIDAKRNVIAGHGRLEAAKKIGFKEVPVIRLEHLTEEQVRAYRIADNRLSEESRWDRYALAQELTDLHAKGYNIEFTGYNVDYMKAIEVDDFAVALGEEEDPLLLDEDEGEVVETGEDMDGEDMVVMAPGDTDNPMLSTAFKEDDMITKYTIRVSSEYAEQAIHAFLENNDHSIVRKGNHYSVYMPAAQMGSIPLEDGDDEEAEGFWEEIEEEEEGLTWKEREERAGARTDEDITDEFHTDENNGIDATRINDGGEDASTDVQPEDQGEVAGEQVPDLHSEPEEAEDQRDGEDVRPDRPA